MKKKQSLNKFLSRKVVTGTALLFLLLASFSYFQLWRTKEEQPKNPCTVYAHYNIPKISPERGPMIEYVFEKGDIKCITTYNITARRPIYIKRYYPKENRTEYFILKPLDVCTENVNAMYDLIQKSKAHIGKYEPQVVDTFSNKIKTRFQLLQQNLRMNREPGYISLGIWHRKEGESTERLVGSVTIDPHQTEQGAKKKVPEGAYGSYFTVDPQYTQVKGIAYISLRALVDHMIHTGTIKNHIILIIDKKNAASNHIAEKLHMKRSEAKDQYLATYWPYPTPKEDCYLYKISVKKWERIKRKKKEKKVKDL